MRFLPVVVRGDSNAQLRGIQAIIRNMPQAVKPSLVDLICNKVGSTRNMEEYVHVNAIPKARVWKDERQGGQIVTIKQTIENDTYEVSLGINGDDWNDDQIGIYDDPVQQAMQSLLLAPDELVTTNLVERGVSITGYDGVAFHAETHKWPEGEYQTAQSNLHTGTGETPSTIEADFNAKVMNAAMTWKDDRGRLKNPAQDFMGKEGIIVHYHPFLRQSMKRVFGTDANGNAFNTSASPDSKSTAAGEATLYPDGNLTDQDDWYVHFTKGVGMAKPYVFQDREAPYVTIFAKGSEHYEKYNEVLILGKRRFGMGVLKPERSHKVTNT